MQGVCDINNLTHQYETISYCQYEDEVGGIHNICCCSAKSKRGDYFSVQRRAKGGAGTEGGEGGGRGGEGSHEDAEGIGKLSGTDAEKVALFSS